MLTPSTTDTTEDLEDALNPADEIRATVQSVAMCIIADAEDPGIVDRKVHRDFDVWVATVRDPAEKANEGIRTLATPGKKATAEYEIAPLPNGRFALSYSLNYRTGSCHGHGSPWHAHPTREACVAAFLAAARHHFTLPVHGSHFDGQEERQGFRSQLEAQRQMLALLDDIDGSLFFVEPEPVKQEMDDAEDDE